MAELLFELSPRVAKLKSSLEAFVEEHCIPGEEEFERQLGEGERRWKRVPPVMETLKCEARRRGLWNLWLPKEFPEGAGLSNAEYAVLAEVTGRSFLAPEACNCSAPDTGNMEVLLRYGTQAQKAAWLGPLLEGKARSAFLMTEPEVASSDAANVACKFMRLPSGGYKVQGRKWWSSGAIDPRCNVAIVLGKVVDETGKEVNEGGDRRSMQTMLLVPMNSPGVTILRALTVFGYDDAPHGHAEVLLENVEVGPEALLLGEGRGFEIAQGRLGPGRVHHCMRMVGLTERCLRLAAARATDPTKAAFGRPELGSLGVVRSQLAQARASVEMTRLLVLACAASLDSDAANRNTGGLQTRSGVKSVRSLQLVALIKAAVPRACERAIDHCLQIFGGAGVSQDTVLARAFVAARSLRLADGPDEVHDEVVARIELGAARHRAVSKL